MAYNSFLAILSITLVPVFVWWRQHPVDNKIKYIGYFIILLFSQGSLDLLGLNQTLVRYLFELPLAIYFILDIIKNGFRKTPGSGYVLLFLLASIPSAIYTSGMMYILFIQEFLLVWITFYCFYNADWSDENCDSINQLFIWLCVSQFFAAILKFLIIGICEPYIGTMASHSGGLTTLFSLTGFCICEIMYFSVKKRTWIWGCIGFILFGLIGEKRALVFMIPAFFFISFLIYSLLTRQFGTAFLKKIVSGVILIPLLFYVMVRINPSFNPDRKIWGDFDLGYTLNYAEKYNSGTLRMDDDNVGRSEALTVFHKHIFNDNLYNVLFGYGAGILVQSAFNHEVSGSVQTYSLNRWGIGYGISIGYITLLAQVGFVGTILYFLIYVSLLRGVYNGIFYNRYYADPQTLGYGISALLCIVIMLFLSMTYNKSSFTFSPVTVALMWFIFYAYKQIYKDHEISNSTF